MRVSACLAFVAAALALGPVRAESQGSPCGPAGAVRFVCGQSGAEDLVAVPGTSWVMVSGMAMNGGVRIVDARTRESTTLFPSATAQERPDRPTRSETGRRSAWHRSHEQSRHRPSRTAPPAPSSAPSTLAPLPAQHPAQHPAQPTPQTPRDRRRRRAGPPTRRRPRRLRPGTERSPDGRRRDRPGRPAAVPPRWMTLQKRGPGSGPRANPVPRPSSRSPPSASRSRSRVTLHVHLPVVVP